MALLPTGGYVSDWLVGTVIEENPSLKQTIFQQLVLKVVNYKLAAIEKTRALTSQESSLRNDLSGGLNNASPGLLRVIEFVKQDASRFVNTNYYTDGANMQVIVDGVWSNILNKYS